MGMIVPRQNWLNRGASAHGISQQSVSLRGIQTDAFSLNNNRIATDAALPAAHFSYCPQKDESMKALLLYPEFPHRFWSFNRSLKFIGKRAALPPLGLLTVAAMLPEGWGNRKPTRASTLYCSLTYWIKRSCPPQAGAPR